MDYTILVPVFNEGKNLRELYRKLKTTMDDYCINRKKEYEIIFVDDGSTDDSSRILFEIEDMDDKVHVLRKNKNEGQSAAIFDGIKFAKGEVIITIDADLQNPPEEIPKLLGFIDKGYDAVSGWRFERKDPFITKKAPSYISNWLARNLYGIDIHDFGCGLKAYKRYVLKDLPFWDGIHRYIIAIIALRGYKVGEVIVKHQQRPYGKSKYGARRLFLGLLDLLYIRLIFKPKIPYKRLSKSIFLSGMLIVIISLLLGYIFRNDEYISGNAIIISIIIFMILGFIALLGYLFGYRYPTET